MLNYFNAFKKSAFRVETLQEYNVDEEKHDYEYFLKYKKLPGWFWDWDDWCDIIQQAKARWAIMQRVHIIQFPMSSYLSFEVEAYKKNIIAWEEIFYIPFEECSIKIESDFWMFDDTTVLKMYYDKDGSFLGFEEIKDIDPYLQIRDFLLKNKRNIEEVF